MAGYQQRKNVSTQTDNNKSENSTLIGRNLTPSKNRSNLGISKSSSNLITPMKINHKSPIRVKAESILKEKNKYGRDQRIFIQQLQNITILRDKEIEIQKKTIIEYMAVIAELRDENQKLIKKVNDGADKLRDTQKDLSYTRERNNMLMKKIHSKKA